MTELVTPASSDYDPFTASPTSISMYELCNRKFAWRYIEGIAGAENKWATFGTNTHGHLERWLGNKIPPLDNTPEQRLAQVMLKHLPPPQAVIPSNVEIELSMRLGGIYFIGKIDLWMPEGYSEVPMPIVYDHKTTGDLQWALTPEGMKNDVQATIYAAWAMLKSRSPQVSVQWTYGVRSPQKAHPVRAVLTGRDIQERLSKNIESAKEMKALTLSGARALDVVYDASACEAFGGCPYKDNCNLSVEERIESIMAQGQEKQMTVEDRLKARRAKATGVNPPAAAPAPAAPAPAAPVPAAPVPAAPATDVAAVAKPVINRLKERRKAGVPTVDLSEAPAPPPPPPEPAEAEAKRGRGRPKGSTNAVKDDEGSMWTLFACAALEGGASSSAAAAAATDLTIEYKELFGE